MKINDYDLSELTKTLAVSVRELLREEIDNERFNPIDTPATSERRERLQGYVDRINEIEKRDRPWT